MRRIARLAPEDISKSPTVAQAKKLYNLKHELQGILDDYASGVDMPADFNAKRLEDLLERTNLELMNFAHFASDEMQRHFDYWVLMKKEN